MTDSKHLDRRALPSAKRLLQATGIALVAAAVILVTTILPAEYGIDPTGIGARLGLTSLSAATTATASEVAAPPPVPTTPALTDDSKAAWQSKVPYRNDEMTVTLKPGEGTEVKALMRRGERLVFSWTVEGGKVNFDMHGEELKDRKSVV